MKKLYPLVCLYLLFLCSCGSDKPPQLVISEYYSPQCESCSVMEPLINEIKAEFKDKITVYRYDLDTPEGTNASRGMEIRTIPIIILGNKEGKIYFRHDGIIKIEILRAQIKKIL